jgi:hypothetical protein
LGVAECRAVAAGAGLAPVPAVGAVPEREVTAAGTRTGPARDGFAAGEAVSGVGGEPGLVWAIVGLPGCELRREGASSVSCRKPPGRAGLSRVAEGQFRRNRAAPLTGLTWRATHSEADEAPRETPATAGSI